MKLEFDMVSDKEIIIYDSYYNINLIKAIYNDITKEWETESNYYYFCNDLDIKDETNIEEVKIALIESLIESLNSKIEWCNGNIEYLKCLKGDIK